MWDDESVRDLGPIFHAEYEGFCSACQGDIEEDQEVRYDDGELKHADCVITYEDDDEDETIN